MVNPAPTSGRSAYVLFLGDNTYVPIFNWNMNVTRDRLQYVTSQTTTYPKRSSGLSHETLMMSGIDGLPTFYASAITSLVDFEAGWLDFAANLRRYVTFRGVLDSFTLNWNYTCTPSPVSFHWEAQFTGVIHSKALAEEALVIDANDPMICTFEQCNKTILAPGLVGVPSGSVRYVRKAKLTASISRLKYATSLTTPYIVGSSGINDTLLDLEIEGDFDYWLSQVNADTSSVFQLHYTPTLFWQTPVMRFLGMNNFNVNAQTGELISASLHLGAGL